MRDASAAFALPAPWTNRIVSSADATVFDAKITGSGAIASHALRPTALAASQSNASGAYAAADTVVGTGTLTIEVGTWTGTTAFAPKAGSTAVNITIGAADNTLEKVRDCMKNLAPRVELPAEILKRARLPIERMLEISARPIENAG